jgi:hypothetical protein
VRSWWRSVSAGATACSVCTWV